MYFMMVSLSYYLYLSEVVNAVYMTPASVLSFVFLLDDFVALIQSLCLSLCFWSSAPKICNPHQYHLHESEHTSSLIFGDGDGKFTQSFFLSE